MRPKIAGHDKKIIVWDIEKGTSIMVLEGHTNVVSSLSLATNGDLVSGSWDQCAQAHRLISSSDSACLGQ